MKLPPQLINLWNRHKTLITFSGILIVLVFVGVIARLLTPPGLPVIPTPAYTPLTPNPGLRSPQEVNLSQLRTVSLPEAAPSLQFTLADFENHRQIANTLGITSAPQVFPNIYSYSNQNFYLTINSSLHSLAFSYNSDSQVSVSGEFNSTQALLDQTIVTLRSLNLYDSQLNFQLLSSNFRQVEDEYLVPSTQSEANVIHLTITPVINGSPIYLQRPMITAIYNRENRLVKLELFSPLTQISQGEMTRLLTLDHVRALPTTAFFPLFITPANIEEAWTGPTGLASIAPEELKLGYFLDSESGLLQPIFTYSGQASADQPYIYATLAFPTTAP